MSLTEVVRMPGADYQAICDAVRAKTGGTELLKSGEVAEQILSISGGMSAKAAHLLITILRNGTYTTDQTDNITALAIELLGVAQIDDVLYIVNAEATQNDDALYIASGGTVVQNGDTLYIVDGVNANQTDTDLNVI